MRSATAMPFVSLLSRPAMSSQRAARHLAAGFVLLILVYAMLAGRARAEDEAAHRIVADIAEHFLQPRAAARLHALLDRDQIASLAALSQWSEGDDIDAQGRARWHRVGIPLNAIAYSPSRDCRNGACVVEKLAHFVAVLRQRSTPPDERLEALKFVVCLISDIHQPLHVVDNGDRGGARVSLIADGRHTNLRQLWDRATLDEDDDARAVADALADSISSRSRHEWQKGSPADWANESHAVARSFVYRYLPQSRVVTAGYESGMQEVTRDRLRRAGVRLAWILNRAL
jgi:nuclease S1